MFLGGLVALFGWLPPGFQVLIGGVLFLFILFTILKLVKLVLDIIPFV